MVGLFSRFSISRNGHRHSQTTIDEREVLPPDTQVTESTTFTGASATAHHGIEVAIEPKPIDYPTEPFDNDQPIHCPLPEPLILDDGRIWKKRVQKMADLEGAGSTQEPGSAGVGVKSQRRRTNRTILPSISAPEHNILKLLEECNASGM